MKMKTSSLLLILIVLFLLPVAGNAQARVKYSINSCWKFHKEDVQNASSPEFDDTNWEAVNIPHTWNALDILDDEAGYYRGTGWYRKTLEIPEHLKDKQIYLFFEGTNQDAVIYVNGNRVGEHHGGYTAFSFNITDYLDSDQENLLAVELSNAFNENVPPVGGDLCHFGGIYRDVYIVALNDVHFDMNFYGSSGIFLRTPKVSEEEARLEISSRISSKAGKEIKLLHTILSPGRKILKKIEENINSSAYLIQSEQAVQIKAPQLWDPGNPALYYLKSQLLDRENNIIDEIITPFGFRSLERDKDRGIILNDKPVFIKGVGKHQDYYKLGYAVPDEVFVDDIRDIKNLGANLVRSHYPLDPSTYDACDRMGILVWGKIPIMDKITLKDEFYHNSREMMLELMYQNYNRPSFILWGFSCEIFGDMDWYWPKPQDEEKVEENIRETKKFSLEMEELMRKTDPYRLTANDFHTDPTPEYYKQAGLTGLNMINGWNIYQGWYHNNLDSIGWALETFRDYNVDVPFVIAEYGAGSDPRIHSYDPTIFDFSIEYQNLFHERYLEEVKKYDFVHGMCLWTLFDFQVDSRADAVPHINSKGLLTSDRKYKDAYYVYKAHWSEEPMIHIAGLEWEKRKEMVKGKTAARPVVIYSNLAEIELYHNGQYKGKFNPDNNKLSIDIEFVEGKNSLRAIGIEGGNEISAYREVYFNFVPSDFQKEGFPEEGLCINAGQSRSYFHEDVSENIWLPDKAYETGTFGHLNGRYYRHWPNMQAWEGIREGVGQNIKGTESDPVFQTFLVGVSDYRIDLPDGEYSVSLLFAEPFSHDKRLIDHKITGAAPDGERIFNVYLNKEMVINEINLAKDFGESQAVKQTQIIEIKNGEGLHIKLEAVKGEPILNGIKIKRY